MTKIQNIFNSTIMPNPIGVILNLIQDLVKDRFDTTDLFHYKCPVA